MGVVIRRWVWVEYMGVASGCGCKKVYRFPHTTYPYSSCICYFLQQHPYLKKRRFSFLFRYFFVIYVFLCNYVIIFFTQYKHTWATTGFPRQPYEAAENNVLYVKKHTQTNDSYSVIDISCMSSRGGV